MYPGEPYGFHLDEKSIPAQRQLEAFYSPIVKPTLAIPQAALSRADPSRQDLVREALMADPAPFGFSPVSPVSPEDQNPTQAFYTPAKGGLPRRDYDAYRTQIGLSRQDSDANTASQTLLSRQAFDPKQREVNHMSYLSSLSSGFGDGLLIAETGQANDTRQSRANVRDTKKFSWTTEPRRGERDTIYTTTSVDSAPRFRSINSWVDQQSGRIERRQHTAQQVPEVPGIAIPLHMGRQHQRKGSEDPAFKHHPGQEVEIQRGSLVPSEILDKKLGLD